MILSDKVSFFSYDGVNIEDSVRRASRLCIASHPDDIEIMSFSSILKSYVENASSFLGIVLTDGAGSPRDNSLKNITNEEIKILRQKEQINAAKIGKYSGVIFLNISSNELKSNKNIYLSDLEKILNCCNLTEIIIHNPFDFHLTHLAGCKKTLQILKKSCSKYKHVKIIGSEVWGSLEWIPDKYKVIMDTSGNDELFESLISCFESQIKDGKRYDIATVGRRLANATFLRYNEIDSIKSLHYGIDLSPVVNSHASLNKYVREVLSCHTKEKLQKLGK